MNNIYTIRNGTIDLNFILKHKNAVGIEAEYKSVDIKFISEVSKAIIRNFYKHYNERTNNTTFPTIVNKKNQMLLDIIYGSMNMYIFHPSIIKDIFYERLYANQILFIEQQIEFQCNLLPVEVRINDEVRCKIETVADFTLSKSLLKVEDIKFITRLNLHGYEKNQHHITSIPPIQALINENDNWFCINDNTIKELRSEINHKQLKKINYIINKRIDKEELNDILIKANFTSIERDKIMYLAKTKEYKDYIAWNLPDTYKEDNLNKELLIKNHYMNEEEFMNYAKFNDLPISPRTILNYINYSIFPEPIKDKNNKDKKYYNPTWIKYLKKVAELKPKLKLGIRNSYMEKIRRKDEAFFKDIPIRQKNIKK